MYEKQNKLVQFCYYLQNQIPHYILLEEIEGLLKQKEDVVELTDKNQVRHAKRIAKKLEDLVRKGKRRRDDGQGSKNKKHTQESEG